MTLRSWGFTRDLVSDVFLLFYPSQGWSCLARIEYIHFRTPLDVIVPTLNPELPAFIETGTATSSLGIATFRPRA